MSIFSNWNELFLEKNKKMRLESYAVNVKCEYYVLLQPFLFIYFVQNNLDTFFVTII